jgi:hypothetical protein
MDMEVLFKWYSTCFASVKPEFKPQTHKKKKITASKEMKLWPTEN